MLHTETLHKNKDFLTLYKRGLCVPMRHIVVYARKSRVQNSAGPHCTIALRRLGITAGKKVGNAVHRNRAKRIIRAAYRAVEDRLPAGIDLVIVARASISEAKSQDIAAQLSGRCLRELTAAFGKKQSAPEASAP